MWHTVDSCFYYHPSVRFVLECRQTNTHKTPSPLQSGLKIEKQTKGVCRTDKGEEHWQEDESVSGTDQHDAQVHAEVKDLENLRFGKCQDDNASKLGQCDTRQDLK